MLVFFVNIHPCDCFQHQSQQLDPHPAIHPSSLATMADVFRAAGNVMAIKTVETDPTSQAAAAVCQLDFKHCSLHLPYNLFLHFFTLSSSLLFVSSC